jgi:hypothetical protein
MDDTGLVDPINSFCNLSQDGNNVPLAEAFWSWSHLRVVSFAFDTSTDNNLPM